MRKRGHITKKLAAWGLLLVLSVSLFLQDNCCLAETQYNIYDDDRGGLIVQRYNKDEQKVLEQEFNSGVQKYGLVSDIKDRSIVFTDSYMIFKAKETGIHLFGGGKYWYVKLHYNVGSESVKIDEEVLKYLKPFGCKEKSLIYRDPQVTQNKITATLINKQTIWNYSNIFAILKSYEAKKSLKSEDYFAIEAVLRTVGNKVIKNLVECVTDDNGTGVYTVLMPSCNITNKNNAKVEYANLRYSVSSNKNAKLEMYVGTGGNINTFAYDMSWLLKKVSDESSIPEQCEYLKQLAKQINNIKEALEQKEQEDIKEENKKRKTGEFPDKEVEQWCYMISRYNHTLGFQTEYYDKQGNKHDLIKDWKTNKLTQEEKMRVRSYAYMMFTLDKEGLISFTKEEQALDQDMLWLYDENKTASYSETGGYTYEVVGAQAREVIERYKVLGTTVAASSETCYVFSDLVKYLAAQSYGMKTTPADTNGDLTLINESPYMESALPDVNAASAYNLIHDKGFSKMKNITKIAATPEANESWLKLQWAVMQAQLYCSTGDGAVSKGDKADGTKDVLVNKKIETFLSTCNGNPEQASQDELSKVYSIIKSYCEISEGMDWLGMDTEFDDNITAACKYANVLKPFLELDIAAEYEVSVEKEAMSSFFSVATNQFSNDYKTGVILSSSFIPLQTNMYSTDSVSMIGKIADSTWVTRFHYPYGFYRKALYIDTNINAAVNMYVADSSEVSTKRVARLKDLFEPEKDIVLTVDQSFYNVDKLIKSQELASANYVYDKLQNTEDAGDTGNASWSDSLTDWWADIRDTNVEAVVKTGGEKTYSRSVRQQVSEFDLNAKDERGTKYVLSSKNIEKYLRGYSENPDVQVFDDYDPIQSFAVVSAIYRQAGLWNTIDSYIRNDAPVFISSAKLAGVTGITQVEFNSIYNYAMLKNLEAVAGIDYKTTLDLNSPLYIDIYGNILTESGLVVIPAVSNATLCNATLYTTATAGFAYLYNNGGYNIPADFNNAKEYIDSTLVQDKGSGDYVLGSKRVNNFYINFRDLPLSDETYLETVMKISENNITKDDAYLNFGQHVYLITEVLRGAPLENIDKEFEGIEGITDKTKTSIYIAGKLEEITEALMGNKTNSLVELPNIAFINGVEYVVLFIYKLVFAITFGILFYRVYIDAVQGVLGVKTVFSWIFSIFLFLIIVFGIPKILDLSYYQANKVLLQDETAYIEMLNLEKKSEGREIGISSVQTPETNSKLYLKLDDLSVPWYELLDDVLFKSTFKTVGQAYDDALSKSPMSSLPGMEKKASGLYIDVQEIFDSTQVEYDPATNALYTINTKTPYASYVTPYYVILDQLCWRINKYNLDNSIKSYNIKYMGDGSVKSSGMIEPYFNSDAFMGESQDILGFKEIYNTDEQITASHSFTDNEVEQMRMSYWFFNENQPLRLDAKLDKLNEEIRLFVADNKNLFNKVSDENFLKVMALVAAVKYNNIMNIGCADAFEIYSLDSKDIIRLSLADNTKVMSYSSKSFVRFVYDEAGVLGVIAVAFLEIIYFIAYYLKIVAIGCIIAVMIISAVIRRMIKKDAAGAVEGVFVTCSLLAGSNILYALVLKLSMMLSQLGINLVLACFGQVILQVLYLLVLYIFVTVVIKDWRNVGYNDYMSIVNGIIHKMNIQTRISRIKTTGNNEIYGYSIEKQKRRRKFAERGNDLMDDFYTIDRRREEHRGRR